MKEHQYDISPMHHKAIALLFHSPGMTQQNLSEQTGRDKSQISRLIKELELKDLIERNQDTDDKRIIRLALTDKGLALFQELRQHEKRLIQSLLLNISDNELDTLDKTFYKMRENLRQLHDLTNK